MTIAARTRDLPVAVGVALAMFALYNANGREIGSYDSQPTKYAARELLLRGTLSLNHVIGRTPELMQRSGFVPARDGRYRSAYSPVPAVLAAAVMWPLWKVGVVDLNAPLASSFMASFASSLIVAIAVGLIFLTARRVTSRGRALFVAVAAGAGTGLWSTASQTLWQHETAILGLTLAVHSLTAPRGRVVHAVAIGIGLGLAGASRMQLAPAIAVLGIAAWFAAGWRRGVITAALAGAIVGSVAILNYQWFGSFLGAAPLLEALHETVHATTGSFHLQLEGFQGLLWSPSRGLLVFSPVAALFLVGVRMPRRGTANASWCLAAAAAQFLLYGTYAVWWGGHTYGPRYMLDLLPLLVPAGAVAADAMRGPVFTTFASLTLAWSVGVSAIGAFCYPNDRWNSEPRDIDRDHARLWDWSDNQIIRAWHAGPSPQNFMLFSRDAVRVPRP